MATEPAAWPLQFEGQPTARNSRIGWTLTGPGEVVLQLMFYELGTVKPNNLELQKSAYLHQCHANKFWRKFLGLWTSISWKTRVGMGTTSSKYSKTEQLLTCAAA